MHKCYHCGQIFEGKFCPECGTAYNIASVPSNGSNLYKSEFDKEKNQCKVLLMLLNNMDIEYLKERALKVLDLNPDNSLAQMIYDCNFTATMYEGYAFLELNEDPLEVYLRKECGNIDGETCYSFLCALVLEAQNNSRIGEIVKYIMNNILRLKLSENVLFELLKRMAKVIGDVSRLNAIAYDAKLNKVAGVLDMFSGNSYSANSFLSDGRSLKELVAVAYNSRKDIAYAFKSQVEIYQLSADKKAVIYNLLGELISQPSNGNKQKDTSSTLQKNKANATQEPSKSNGKKAGGIALVAIGIITACLGFVSWSFFILGGLIIGCGAGLIEKSKKS